MNQHIPKERYSNMTLLCSPAQLFVGVTLSVATLCAPRAASACTSFLVTRGASADGSTMITYAADSHELYGELYFRPSGRHPAGSTTEIRDWDSNKLLGSIPQVAQTWRVVGNMNEHQVAIGETTFGGQEALENPKGGIDYGSLIYVSLQRAKTAREVISVMSQLVEEHGYASKGESFSISDPNEVWLMELIGKGPGSKGANWVALRVPDGHVSAHANQARIQQFPRNDPDNCQFSKDVVSFAREKGYFSGKDEDFSFTSAYSPPKCNELRSCDARVWSFYHRVAPSLKIPMDYVKCKPGAPPLPVWIKPDSKLSARDLMRLMRDHFEDTDFDMRKDIGAGPYTLPYRWRPLTWKLDGKTYANERATATQQTGFSFVSQSRASLPNPVGGLLWFSVDDAASTVYVPMYSGIKKVSKPYAVGTGSFTTFSWDSAFWVFNWVANQAYGRYGDMIVDIQKVQAELEGGFLGDQAAIEDKAAKLYKTSPGAAEEFLTRYSDQAGERVVARWRQLGQDMLVKYMDGNVRDDKGKVLHPPYPEWWYRKIASETGDRLVVDTAPSASASGSAPAASASAAAALSASSATPPAPPPASKCSYAPVRGRSQPSVILVLGLSTLLSLRRRLSRAK
jgi:dipeptidase